MQKSFIAKVTTLASSSFLAHAVTLSLMPIITRLYPPDIYGEFTIFMSIVSIIVPITALRYGEVILLPKNDRQANDIVIICYCILVAITTAVVFLTFSFKTDISSILKIKNKWIVYFIPMAVFLGGLASIFRFWNLRLSNYKTIGISGISGTIANRAFAIVLGLYQIFLSSGLILAWLINKIIEFLILFFFIKKNVLKFKNSSMSGLWQLALKYKTYPQYSIANLLNPLSKEAPVILLSFYYSPIIVAYYGLCKRIFMQPSIMIATAIQNSYFESSAKMYRTNKDITVFTEQLILLLCFLSITPVGIFASNAQYLITVVFGEDWFMAGKYIIPLSLMACVQFIVKPFISLFDVFQMQKQLLIYNTSLLVGDVLIIIIGASFFDDYMCIILFSCADSITRLSTALWLITKTNIQIKQLTIKILPCFILLAFGLFPIMLLKQISMNEIIILSISILILVLYSAYLILFCKPLQFFLKK